MDTLRTRKDAQESLGTDGLWQHWREEDPQNLFSNDEHKTPAAALICVLGELRSFVLSIAGQSMPRCVENRGSARVPIWKAVQPRKVAGTWGRRIRGEALEAK